MLFSSNRWFAWNSGIIFSPLGKMPSKFAVECDKASSMITEIDAGRGPAIVCTIFKQVAGKRLTYRNLAGIAEAHHVGIAEATHGKVTPAVERFCEVLRKAVR